jgi:hypothetical protein
MALVKCSECGSDVSDLAQSCPKCGAPVAIEAPKDRGHGCVVAILVIVGIFILLWFVSSSRTPPDTDQHDSNKPDPNDILKNATFLKGNPDFVPSVRELIERSGYECPAISGLWSRGESPYGPRLEALCGPHDGSGSSYPKLHYAVYPKKLKVSLCSEFGAFSADCS